MKKRERPPVADRFLLERAAAGRDAIRFQGADPELTLALVAWPSDEVLEAQGEALRVGVSLADSSAFESGTRRGGPEETLDDAVCSARRQLTRLRGAHLHPVHAHDLSCVAGGHAGPRGPNPTR